MSLHISRVRNPEPIRCAGATNTRSTRSLGRYWCSLLVVVILNWQPRLAPDKPSLFMIRRRVQLATLIPSRLGCFANFLRTIDPITVGLVHSQDFWFEHLITLPALTHRTCLTGVVRRGGELQCSADRHPTDSFANRCNELPPGLTVEPGRKENRRVFQNGIRPTQVLILTF
jgi:hypothetical protein